MFYFIRFVDNDIVRIILLTGLVTLLFYTIGNITQRIFHFQINNNNFTIPLGIIVYFLLTFILYTPFLYLHLDAWENLLFYLYLIKQFIFTFVVLLFINSLFAKWKVPSWKQINNILFSIIILGLLLWLFHFLLLNISITPSNDDISLFFNDENLQYQSVITELNIIIEMNNNITQAIVIEWIIPFVIVNLLYWSFKLLFTNVWNPLTFIFSSLFTIIVLSFLSFFMVQNLFYILFPIIFFYFVLVFLYTREAFGNNLIILFALFVLASLFTISKSGIAFLILLGLPMMGYLFFRAKSTATLFLIYFTFFCVELFFMLNTLNIFFIYGLIFLLIAVIVLIPMYAILNPAKIKDLIQLEKTIKKNAPLILYFSLSIVILLSLLLGLKSDNSVFRIIEKGFTEMLHPKIIISFTSVYVLYFSFCFYISFFKKNKVNNFLLYTSLLMVISFNPLTLPLFQYINLLKLNLFSIYFFILSLCIFLNLFKYIQDKLNSHHIYIYNNLYFNSKIFVKNKQKLLKTNSFKEKNK